MRKRSAESSLDLIIGKKKTMLKTLNMVFCVADRFISNLFNCNKKMVEK